MELMNSTNREVMEAELKDSIKKRDAIAKKYGERRAELFDLFKSLADSQNCVLHIQEDMGREGYWKPVSYLHLPHEVQHWAACGLMLPEDAEYFKSVMGEGIPSSYDFSKYWLLRCGKSLEFGMDDLTGASPDYDRLMMGINAAGNQADNSNDMM